MIRLDEHFPEYYRRVTFNNKGSVQFQHCDYPVSISEREYEFIQTLVEEENLSFGLEVATGTGLSSVAFASKVRDLHRFGYLLTIDCYIEEAKNSCNSYFLAKDKYLNTEAYNIIKNVSKKLDLVEYIDVRVGRSPEDLSDIIYENEGFDYIFIDAEHTTNALINDLRGVAKYASKDGFVLIHDMHCFNIDEVNNVCMELFGAIPKLAPDCGLHQSGYNLNYLKVKK